MFNNLFYFKLVKTMYNDSIAVLPFVAFAMINEKSTRRVLFSLGGKLLGTINDCRLVVLCQAVYA